jgi:hypothetical protein
MHTIRLAPLALIALATGIGCSSSSSSAPPGGEPADTGGTSSGGFSLRVVKAGLTQKLSPIAAGAGNVFVVLDVTIKNDSVTPSLSENLAFFALSTKSSLVVHASPATATTATPCRAEVGVASGGSATCQLAFEIATSDVATTLAFDDLQGHTASASIPTARALPPAGSMQPPERPTAPGVEGVTQWFVVDQLRLGTTDRAGISRPDAWKAYGYDLDLRITTADDAKVSNGICKRRAGAPTNILMDGDGGIDNNFGGHFMQTMRSLKSDVEDATNAGIRDGKGTLLLRLDHVGGADSASVPGALFATASSSPPAFDGTDALPVDGASVDGTLDKPLATFPGGYMVGGVWVSGDLPGGAFTLPLRLGGGTTAFPLDGGVITVRVEDGKNGTIAGVIATTGFADALTPWAKAYGICPGNATFDQLMETMTQSADLIAGAPNFQDPARECDAISLGIGFTMVKAAPPTTVVPPVAPPDGCK